MSKLPELPEGYVWRVSEFRKSKYSVAPDGYSLSVIDAEGGEVLVVPMMEDPEARRKLEELADAVTAAELAYFSLREGWFSKAKAMKAGAYEAYWAARDARGAYMDGLDLAAKELAPEVILHSAEGHLSSVLSRIAVLEEAKLREQADLEAAERSARFVGDYPPLALELS